MLRLEVSRKAFAGREVLEGVRLNLAAGEIVAVTGPSGCGKSTLLRLVAGLDRDFVGALEWATPPHLAMVFQDPRLLPWRGVMDNLVLAGATPDDAQAMLTALDLADEAATMADRLSLGMARRVALARALSVARDVLLLDEPFVSLDAASAAGARALLLRRWSERGFAVLLVTHDLFEAASLADRILVLSGRPARVAADLAVPEALRRRGGADAANFVACITQP
jgi:NitT/TauT family transport system ATP-binding protein